MGMGLCLVYTLGFSERCSAITILCSDNAWPLGIISLQFTSPEVKPGQWASKPSSLFGFHIINAEFSDKPTNFGLISKRRLKWQDHYTFISTHCIVKYALAKQHRLSQEVMVLVNTGAGPVDLSDQSFLNQYYMHHDRELNPAPSHSRVSQGPSFQTVLLGLSVQMLSLIGTFVLA